jgi:hypothetical protein
LLRGGGASRPITMLGIPPATNQKECWADHQPPC